MGESKIEWTDTTWNPVTGCTKVSAGCKNCYAEGVAHRFWGERKFADVQFHPARLGQPLRWRKPRRVFVNSMSDLFHESLSNEQIAAVFGVMAACPQHTFQVLTKRPERMREWFDWYEGNSGAGCSAYASVVAARDGGCDIGWPLLHGDPWPLPNVWIGVSVEDQERADERIPLLLQTPAAVRFLRVEPMLGPVDLGRWMSAGGCPACADEVHPCNEPRINWVIVGGESGPGARPCNVEWIRSVVRQCQSAGVPCFVRQLGARPYDSTGEIIPGETQALSRPGFRTYPGLQVQMRDRKGGDPSEWPLDLRVRQFPEARGDG